MMDPGPRVQPEREIEFREKVGGIALVGLLAAALAWRIVAAPDAQDVATDLRMEGIEVPPPDSLDRPEDAAPVSYWSFQRVRSQRDSLERKVRCLRQFEPDNGQPTISLRRGLAYCGLK